MRIGRRDFLKLAAAAVAAGKLAPAVLARLYEKMLSRDAPRVIWLQGAGCDGCAVSVLNSIYYASVDELLLNTLEAKFQNNVMAAAGDLAISAAQGASAEPGYILMVEGAIPTGASGKYCQLWPGLTMAAGVQSFAANAGYIVALGTCASYGGASAGAPNPTQAQGVGQILGSDPRLINVPGCPAHPDRLVGTLIYLINNGHIPPLDAYRRPLEFYGQRVHDNCFKRHKLCGQPVLADKLSDEGCMEYLGCKGKKTYSDCPIRKWNAGASGQYGANWCIGAHSPCLGCVEPTFPDGMSPFYVYSPTREQPEPDASRDETAPGPAPSRRRGRRRRSRSGVRPGVAVAAES
jgi:NiFe hydrogenase small subunit HydA